MQNEKEFFDECMDHVFRWEGGYVNHPRDPGGETNWGICKRDFPHLDIRNLTKEEAKDIYYKKYWKAAKCDQLPPAVAFVMLDGAINQGVRASAKCLQRAIKVKDDGQIGPITLAAINRKKPGKVARDFCARRAERYAKTRNFKTFGWGWMRRLMSTTMHATKLVEKK